MALQKLKDSFTNSSFGKKALPTIAAFGIATMPFAAANADDANNVHAQPVAHQQTPSCAPLKNNERGIELYASASAHQYSQNNIGAVGISIYPGADLKNFTADQLGTTLVEVLKRKGIEAQCFVNNSQFHDSGTALGFKVAGLSIAIDGDNAFNMKQIQDDRRILAATVNEAKTAKQLLASNNNTLALRR